MQEHTEEKVRIALTLPVNTIEIMQQMLTDILTSGQVLQADMVDGTLNRENIIDRVNATEGCDHWFLVTLLELVSGRTKAAIEEDKAREEAPSVEELISELEEMIESMNIPTEEKDAIRIK